MTCTFMSGFSSTTGLPLVVEQPSAPTTMIKPKVDIGKMIEEKIKNTPGLKEFGESLTEEQRKKARANWPAWFNRMQAASGRPLANFDNECESESASEAPTFSQRLQEKIGTIPNHQQLLASTMTQSEVERIGFLQKLKLTYQNSPSRKRLHEEDASDEATPNKIPRLDEDEGYFTTEDGDSASSEEEDSRSESESEDELEEDESAPIGKTKRGLYIISGGKRFAY